MTTVIPPDHAQFTQHILHSGTVRESAITGGVIYDGVAGDTTVANAIKAAFDLVAFRNQLDDTCFVGPCSVRVGTGAEPRIATSTTPNQPGLLVAPSVPPNVAVLVTKNTALGGRKHRGRWFFPWFANEGSVDELGIMSAGTVLGKQTAVDAVLNALNDAPLEGLVILHDDQSPPPHNPTLVDSLTVSNLVATQRRRLGR